MSRLRVIAFSMLETCFSPEPLRDLLTRRGLPPHLLELWLTETRRDGFAFAVNGHYTRWNHVAGESLRRLLARYTHNCDSVDSVLEAFRTLPPEDDVRPALELLRAHHVRAVALTNLGADDTRACLDKADLLPFIETIVSADDIRQWKPGRDIYHYAALQAGVEPEEIAVVTAHFWDSCGAMSAGCQAGLVRRPDTWNHDATAPPDAIEDDLPTLCARLLGVPPPP